MGGVWSRSLESLLCELWGNFGGILEHGSIHLSARAVAERYFFGKFIPEVPSKSGSGRVGRTKTVPDYEHRGEFRETRKFLVRSVPPRNYFCDQNSQSYLPKFDGTLSL